jgi:hypothetical protein
MIRLLEATLPEYKEDEDAQRSEVL